MVDSYDPALKRHRTVCFLCFNGHCYMCRCVKRVLEPRGARCTGEARQELPPMKRFDPALPLEPEGAARLDGGRGEPQSDPQSLSTAG